MARKVGLYEAKTHLSELVEAAAAGEEIVITRHGRPVARLAPLVETQTAERRQRRLGAWRGLIHFESGWDEPLPEDMIAAMYGDGPDNERDEPPPR
jgi:prevent-host-death family protein